MADIVETAIAAGSFNTLVTAVQAAGLVETLKSGVKVNNANVVKTDIECDNGVIHVIDTVLMPK